MLPTVLPGSTGVSSGLESSDTRPLGLRFRPARSTSATLSICSPPSFETLAKDNRRRVHDHQKGKQHDDGARGFFGKTALGTVRPEEYLHRQHRRGIGDAF